MARKGRSALVITVDPARRLADALGTDVGRLAQEVSICPRSDGRLFARMPDTRMSLDDFVDWLFQDPAQRQRVRSNPAYLELGDSLAGVHELITIGLLQTEIDSGRWDEVVLDTAPSRHALAFLTYPSRLLGLLEARALGWLAALSQTAEPSTADAAPKHGLFAWGRSKAEAIVGKLVGLDGLRNLSSLFGDMVSVRERWADLARRTNQLLRTPDTRYLIIGAPTGGAMADAQFLVANLQKHGLQPSAIVLNRAESEPPPCEQRVLDALAQGRSNLPDHMSEPLRRALLTMHDEHASRAAAAQRATVELRRIAPNGTPIVRLPFVHRSDPRAIVLALADAWETEGEQI